jgi:hypothetical protein
VANQVVLVQALHDQDDAALFLIVESAIQRFAVPFVNRFSLAIRRCFIRLEGVVDDNHVGAAAGQHSTNGGRKPGALLLGYELLHRLPLGGETRRVEGVLVPFARHHAPAVPRKLIREVLRVADA